VGRVVKILRVFLPAVFFSSLSFCSVTPAADLLAKGQVDQSIELLKKTVASSPNDAASYNLLCRSYYAIRNWDRGIEACEKAVSLEPNNGVYHLWLGRVYGEKADSSSVFSAPGWAKKTRVEFENAVRLAPDNVEAHSNLAEYYFEAPGFMGGGQDKAEGQAQILDKLSPAMAHWVRGKLAEKRKDSAAAEKEYRAAIDVSKGGALAWFDLALFFRKSERFSDMEDALNHAVSAPMDHPEVVMESADVLIRSGRNFGLAAQLLHRYLDSDSKVEEAPAFKAHYLLGTLLEKQGNQKAAAEQYSAALAMAKEFSPAQEALKRVNR
jgi:tetratricopeptide (TPR) repeat protein